MGNFSVNKHEREKFVSDFDLNEHGAVRFAAEYSGKVCSGLWCN